MYHFIRRCFVMFLVLAFGFSFLLCCLVHIGWCQLPIGTSTYYDYANWDYGGVSVPYMTMAVGARGSSNDPYENLKRTYQLPQSGLNLTQVPKYSIYGMPTLGGYIEAAIMDQTRFALGTRNQQYIPNLVSQSYIPSVVTGAYGLPLAATGNHSTAQIQYPSAQITMPVTFMAAPGTYTGWMSPETALTQKLLDMFGSPHESTYTGWQIGYMGYGYAYW